METNLYVVVDDKDATPKLGISLGIAPPDNNAFAPEHIYQSYI